MRNLFDTEVDTPLLNLCETAVDSRLLDECGMPNVWGLSKLKPETGNGHCDTGTEKWIIRADYLPDNPVWIKFAETIKRSRQIIAGVFFFFFFKCRW
jgi:hypothetical protein